MARLIILTSMLGGLIPTICWRAIQFRQCLLALPHLYNWLGFSSPSSTHQRSMPRGFQTWRRHDMLFKKGWWIWLAWPALILLIRILSTSSKMGGKMRSDLAWVQDIALTGFIMKARCCVSIMWRLRVSSILPISPPKQKVSVKRLLWLVGGRQAWKPPVFQQCAAMRWHWSKHHRNWVGKCDWRHKVRYGKIWSALWTGWKMRSKG